MNSRDIIQTLLISAVFFLCTSALANDREQFNNAYRDYQQHINANEIEPAMAAASDAFRYGSRLFGKETCQYRKAGDQLQQIAE